MHLIDCATFIPFFGPQDVMDVITERTYAAIHYYERTEPGYEPKTLEYLKKIKRKIFDEGFDLEKTQTVINDFRINIFTGESGRAVSSNWYGNLRVLNNFPNIFYSKYLGGHKAVYQWLSKNRLIVSKKSENDSKFRITMVTSPLTGHRIFFKLFIYIGAILGFASFFIK